MEGGGCGLWGKVGPKLNGAKAVAVLNLNVSYLTR